MKLPRLRPRNVFYGWWVVAAGAVINAVGTGINWYGFTVFFLPLTRELELGRASTSLLFSASRLQAGLFMPIAGWLTDRFGPRRIILGGVAIMGLGYLLLTQAHTFWLIFVVYISIISLGYNAGTYAPVSTAVNAWFIRYKSLAMSIALGAESAGGFFVVPLLALLVEEWGWRYAALAAGLLIWVVVLPMGLVMHRSPESRGLYPDGQPPGGLGKGVARGARATPEFTTGEALRTSAYWLLAGAISLRIAGVVAIIVHMIPILVWKGLSEPAGALVVSMLALGSIPSRLFFGWLGIRHSNTLLSAAGVFAAAAGVTALLVLPRWTGVYLFIGGLMILDGTITLNWITLGTFFGRKSFAMLQGLMGPMYSVGSFTSPIFAGWVYDRTQSYTVALVAFASLLGMAGTMFLLIRRPSKGY